MAQINWKIPRDRGEGQIMSQNYLDGALIEIVRTTASRAKQLGFKRRGMTLRKIYNGNVAIVEFQKSQNKTSETILFTVNLAIVCGTLLDLESISIENAKSYDGHFRLRIGNLLQSPGDHWWKISNDTDSKALASEISDLICLKGIPYIEQYFSDDRLIKLWESGVSPGLTEGQRIKNINEIKNMSRRIDV